MTYEQFEEALNRINSHRLMTINNKREIVISMNLFTIIASVDMINKGKYEIEMDLSELGFTEVDQKVLTEAIVAISNTDIKDR